MNFCNRVQSFPKIVQFVIVFLFGFNNGGLAEEIPGELWVQVASRASEAEALDLASGYVNDWPFTRVFISKNGVYAITIGTIKENAQEPLFEKWKQNKDIPQDSLLISGKNYVRDVPIPTVSQTSEDEEEFTGNISVMSSEAARVRPGEKYRGQLTIGGDVIFQCYGYRTDVSSLKKRENPKFDPPNIYEEEDSFELILNFDDNTFVVFQSALLSSSMQEFDPGRYNIEKVSDNRAILTKIEGGGPHYFGDGRTDRAFEATVDYDEFHNYTYKFQFSYTRIVGGEDGSAVGDALVTRKHGSCYAMN